MYKGKRTKKDLIESSPRNAIIPTARKIANNTLMYYLESGERAIQLHDSIILLFGQNEESVALDTDGWKTPTTKERMNAFLPWSIRVFQRNSEWYIDLDGEVVDFFDGITLKMSRDGKWKVE